VYKKEWKGWGDWLGTGTIATLQRDYRSFEQAREYGHKLGLKNWDEWEKYRRSGKKPEDIPYAAPFIYKEEWKGFPDWLGYEEIGWSAVLYSFLLRKGLLKKISILQELD
jgi:hypothetical protein